MANMSYCRFENTFNDFYDCYSAVQEMISIKELSPSEREYMLSLAEMARRFVNAVEDLPGYDTDEKELVQDEY
jgi:hypothetical protein